MVKTIFKYGAMNAGKSLDLLSQEYNFRNRGLQTFIVKPSIDTRDTGIVKSRTGLSRPIDFELSDNYGAFFKELNNCLNNHTIIFFDEAQFLNKGFVNDLFSFINCPQYQNSDSIIFFYGLLTDFNTNMFEGTSRLLSLCDESHEVPTVCEYPYCTKKARFNLLKDNSVHDTNVHIGDDAYMSVCYKHYLKLS